MNRDGFIDPELHGLLDEIVADPRSALRLTPRKALSSWIFGDERAPRSLSATHAGRHLLEAHREALAEILIQASRVAFWKAPGMAIRVESASRTRIGPVTEAELQERIGTEARQNPLLDPVLGTLLGTWPLRAESAGELARASLALVPSDEARYAVALALPEGEAATAIALLEPLVARQEKKRNVELVCRLLSTLGSRQAAAIGLESARSTYARCRGLAATAVAVEYYVANLSCYLDDPAGLREAARRIDADSSAWAFAEANRHVLSAFAGAQDPLRLALARKTIEKVADLPPALMTAFEALR